MTDKRMALVPREATEEMCLEAKYSPVTTEDQAAHDYAAMLLMSPHGGKVSRELFVAACLSAKQFAGVISQTRAVIEALGLEIEE